MAIARRNPVVAHIHQVLDQGVDMSVQHAGIKMSLRFKISGRYKSGSSEHPIAAFDQCEFRSCFNVRLAAGQPALKCGFEDADRDELEIVGCCDGF